MANIAPASLATARTVRRLKFAAARLAGLSPNDVYILRNIRNRSLFLKAAVAPAIECVPARAPDDRDIALCQRLIDAYRLAVRETDARCETSPLWARNLKDLQAPLRHLLLAGDPRKLADLLATMFRSSIVVGFHPGNLYRGRNWRIHALRILDAIQSAGSLLSPADMAVPEIGAPFGLRIDGHLIGPGAAEHAYAALRVSELRPPSVLEIGGGYGGAALKILQRGIRHYTIVDLPEINAIQGYYLAQALGHERVSLYGEDRKGVAVLPPPALDSHEPVDLAFNQDSFPEIPPPAAERYAEWIATKAQRLYSYNHELIDASGEFGILKVPDLMAGRMSRIEHRPSPLQSGYFEEIWQGK